MPISPLYESQSFLTEVYWYSFICVYVYFVSIIWWITIKSEINVRVSFSLYQQIQQNRENSRKRFFKSSTSMRHFNFCKHLTPRTTSDVNIREILASCSYLILQYITRLNNYYLTENIARYYKSKRLHLEDSNIVLKEIL